MGQQPRTRREIREAERRRSPLPVIAGALGVVLLVAAVWVGKNIFASSSPTAAPSMVTGALSTTTTAPTSTATPTETTPTTSETSQPTEVDVVAAAVASCRARWGVATTARNDLAVSLAQWDRHLVIMNTLQAGKITLATAKTEWAKTTAKAPENVATFRTADRALAASKDTCAVPASATTPEAEGVRKCAVGLRTIDGVLARGRTAIAPWETHLKDQSHFKSGGMTAASAEAKWRALWQRGLATLPAYNAVKAQGTAAGCPLPS